MNVEGERNGSMDSLCVEVFGYFEPNEEREIVAACTQMEINGNLFEMLRQIKASIIPGHFPFCFAEGLFSLDNTVKC